MVTYAKVGRELSKIIYDRSAKIRLIDPASAL